MNYDQQIELFDLKRRIILILADNRLLKTQIKKLKKLLTEIENQFKSSCLMKEKQDLSDEYHQIFRNEANISLYQYNSC
jgi:regulator of replication initiation timing